MKNVRNRIQLFGRGFEFLIGFLILLGAGHVRSATIDLHEFFPYRLTDNIGNSSLLSTTGTGFEFRFYSTSGTRDSGFDWDFRKGTAQSRPPFRRQTLRRDASGISVRVNTFYDYPNYARPVHSSVMSPLWIIAPQMVDEGDVIASSGAYDGTDFATPWAGTTMGTVTIGTIENRHTPAGKTDVLPFTFEYQWSDTGTGSWGSGMVSQTWWLTRELGAFQVSYFYRETNTVGEVFSESDEFHIQTSVSSTNTTVVTFPDPNLEAVVRNRVGKPTGDITAWDMAFLLSINVANAGVTDLSGLEHAYRLSSLTLTGNSLTDLSVLTELPNLTLLNLTQSDVTDIQPLAGLTNLTQLTLTSNSITSVAALLNLTNLERLTLSDNSIADLDGLQNLASLTHLVVTRNQLTDLEELQNLNDLQILYADENIISDVSGLAGLPKLGFAILGSNRIVDVSPLASLPSLVHLEIEQNLVHDLTPLAGLDLNQASVEENCLDVAPGADDRLVIQGWLMGGTQVEDEWPLQYDCEPTVITIGLAVTGDVPALQWLSEVGDSYQIESSTNLLDWVDVPTGYFDGTGGVIQWTGSITTLPQEYYRVRLESAP